MNTTPQQEIDELLLDAASENVSLYEGIRESFAFDVARRVVKYKDPGLIDKMPEWVKPFIHEFIGYYKRDGSFGWVSNLGSVDHTPMVRDLADLLPEYGHDVKLR